MKRAVLLAALALLPAVLPGLAAAQDKPAAPAAPAAKGGAPKEK